LWPVAVKRGVTSWLMILVDETGGFEGVLFVVVVPKSVF
jgi:hypothetical protein